MRRIGHTGPLLRQRPVQHCADRSQHINRANDRGPPAGKNGHEPKGLPRAEEDADFAREVGEARQTAPGERSHHQRRADERQAAEQAAQPVHLQRAGLLVKVTAQAKRQRRQKAVRDHHQHRPAHPDDIQGGNTQENKAHVGDARIPDQPIKVLLAHGHPAAIEQVPQTEPGDNRHPVPCRVRQQWQGDADQAVKAKLLDHAGVDHRGGRRSRTVAQWRPGVKRPERDQDAKAEQQQRENEVLGARREPVFRGA